MSLFISLRHPRDFTSHTSRRGTLFIYVDFLGAYLVRISNRPWLYIHKIVCGLDGGGWNCYCCCLPINRLHTQNMWIGHFVLLNASILIMGHGYVVVFTLNRCSCPTTSALSPGSFLSLHHTDIQILWSQTVRQRKTKRVRLKVGKSSASVPGTRATQKKRHPRNMSYDKKKPNE